MFCRITGFTIALVCAAAATATESPAQVPTDLKYTYWLSSRAEMVVGYCKEAAPQLQGEMSTAHQRYMAVLLDANRQIEEAQKTFPLKVSGKVPFKSEGDPLEAEKKQDPTVFCASFRDMMQAKRADTLVEEERESWNRWLSQSKNQDQAR